MKRIFISIIAITLVMFSGLLIGVYAQEKNTGKESRLTVPWDEFKKLVNIYYIRSPLFQYHLSKILKLIR